MPDNIDTRTVIVKSASASISVALPELANIIRTEHAAVGQAAHNVLAHVLILGRALIAAREQVPTKPKGQWKAWLLANCSIGERQARRYIALLRALDARGHSVSADLVNLSLRGLMRRFAPPKGQQWAGKSRRVPTAAPQQRLSLLIWANAALTEQAHFISAIGWQSLAEVIPEGWYPIICEWLEARLCSNKMPIVVGQNASLAPDDLGIPTFLRREQPTLNALAPRKSRA